MGYSTHDGNGRRRSRETGESADVPGGLVENLHQMFIELGIQSERRGERHAALELYKRAVATDPDSALAWYNYGDILLALDKDKQAVDALSEAVRLNDDVPLYHYDLGLALHRIGRHAEAEDELAPIVAEDPKLERAASTLGLSAMYVLALAKDSMKQPLEAIEILRPALETAYKILYNMARFHLQARKYCEAIRIFKAAEILEPEKEEVVHGIGWCLMRMRRNEAAMVYLKRAVKLDCTCQSAWYDLGVVFARQKMRKQARPCFRKARALKPKDPWPHYDLACLDALEGKADAAFRALKMTVACGFADVKYILQDSDFESIRADERWQPVIEAIRTNPKQKKR